MNRRTIIPVIAFSVITAASPVDSNPGESPSSPTLLAIMRDLGQETRRVTAALLVEDYETMASAANTIADHPKPSASERTAILKLLGPRAGEFREYDERVHNAALELATAAGNHQVDSAVASYNKVIENCVACHASFRDEIRELREKGNQPLKE